MDMIYDARSRLFVRQRRHRIAALVTYEYPAPDQAQLYERVEAAGSSLDAEVAFFHTVITDPRRLGAAPRRRVGLGFWVPGSHKPPYHLVDRDHFRGASPGRLAGLTGDLASAQGMTESQIQEGRDLNAALTCSRWIQAWGADAVLSWYVNQQALFALVASRLLGIPLFVHLPTIDGHGAFAFLIPLLVESAALVIVDSKSVEQSIVDRFGESVRARIACVSSAQAESPTLLGLMSQRLASPRPDGALQLGVRAAFVSDGPPIHLPKSVGAFVVLGAERTGSNMLVEAVDAQSGFLCAGELFNPRLIREGTMPWCRRGTSDVNDLLRLREEGPGRLLPALLEEAAMLEARWVGFKLMYLHGLLDGRVLSFLANVPGLKIVHLLRADRVRRWISHHKADVLDAWYSADGGAPSASPQLELGVLETLTDFAFVELMESTYSALFTGFDALELDYDDFAFHLSQTGRKLGEFFGVELGVMSTRSKKTGVRSLDGVVSNLQELREAMTGTRWEAMFDT